MNADLHAFLEKIMAVNDLTMAGAMSGIVGAAGASAGTIDNLKKTALAFAVERGKPAPDEVVVRGLEQKIIGYLTTLQVMSVLSEKTADALIAETQKLTNY